MADAPKPTPLAEQFSSSEMNWFHSWFTYLDGKLTAIKEENKAMAVNVAAMQAALTKLQTDVTTLTASIPAVIAKAAADEAAAQTAVDGVTTALTNLDATVVAATPAP